MRTARVPVGAALLFLTMISAPLGAAQGDEPEEFFPNACRDVSPLDAVATGLANPLTVILNGEESTPLVGVDSAQATQVGPGKSGDRSGFLDVAVPDDEDPIVHAQVLTGRVDLDVDGPEDGLESEAWSNTRVVGLNVLDGLITADVVRGFAYARSDVRSARTETDPSTIVGLKIEGVSVTDIAPGGNVTLPILFGEGSYVSWYERIDHSQMPTDLNPFYVADVRVRMLNIHITNAPLVGTVDVIVSESYSRAVSPTPFCGLAQGVEAGAYTMRVRSGFEEPGILIGEQHIGVTGGSGHQQLYGQTAQAGSVQVFVNTTETDVDGSIEAGVSSDSRADSRVLYLCVKMEGEPCLVEATVIEAEVECTATADGADCTGTVIIQALTIDGTDVCVAIGQGDTCQPPPDTEQTIGPFRIIMNQQERFEDDGFESLYVRAIRIETPIPEIGTIIIGRAYASAAFEHAGTPSETDPWHE